MGARAWPVRGISVTCTEGIKIRFSDRASSLLRSLSSTGASLFSSSSLQYWHERLLFLLSPATAAPLLLFLLSPATAALLLFLFSPARVSSGGSSIRRFFPWNRWQFSEFSILMFQVWIVLSSFLFLNEVLMFMLNFGELTWVFISLC